ncbi:chemotaxis protein CheB [Paraburkholderia lycopersici]|uniref:protein-glutamate methylesterase n=1 Tax=Paraburkholderia lycopersici TaxID=416944 RepID=A0A1G7CXN8_9BURK|nr:chemotaxis protein CheB [Paraburkholderia lycopersici]SDE43993.1 two-component system, chemotaxis family, response regulator CheB [Paraburkholderia lycopersici]
MNGRIIVIGASYGGFEALSLLIAQLPANFPAPVFIVQHLGTSSTGALPRILGRAGCLPVAHPHHGEFIRGGRIYVAPPEQHMLVQQDHIELSHGPRENHFRPAVDPLFRSAAFAYGPAVVGVVLTGHLDDGTAGLMAIKDRGGTAVVQEPSEAIAPSMPASALSSVSVDHRCTLAEMGALLVTLANDDATTPTLVSNDELIATEVSLAEGNLAGAIWSKFEAMALPSGLTCPDCQTALFVLRDRRTIRFRCRAGHAFSARSLLCAQEELRESKLAALFGTLREAATLARLLLETRAAQNADFRVALSTSIDAAEREAAQVSEWLRTTSGAGSQLDASMAQLFRTTMT